jgi:hypothetical protein
VSHTLQCMRATLSPTFCLGSLNGNPILSSYSCCPTSTSHQTVFRTSNKVLLPWASSFVYTLLPQVLVRKAPQDLMKDVEPLISPNSAQKFGHQMLCFLAHSS